MNKKSILILAFFAAFCFIVAAGCTGVPTNPTPVPSETVHYPTVSINTTPVKYVRVNGVDLAYREYGSGGEPILLNEGFGETQDTAWNATFLGIVATKYHVYTYDYRGVGYSNDTPGNHTIAEYADDAAALMQALGYSSMNVYGQSMGSCISQQLVIDHPERVRKLVLDSVSYSIRIPEAQNLYNKIEAVANNTTPASPGITKEAYACLAWNGTWNGLSGISQNTMLVVGTADVITPQAIAVQMAGQINGTWLVRFKDLPHIGNHEAPVEYGENALDFLGMNESPPYANP
ncbi:pimeloyl-ACP methyl ester carboxylesterase [Methanolinea mesophila]|uniref:alpha/beta fold hydrolase n=1 Tax=Methanolinea mesophila TaxID=547055 RepID=UPI001AE27FD9|nr:alpha/beta hydrolase [Methanolinea mesophila]MBP1928928.1 pimeloyl-ACP methyl ester carboxylesterase [Methanolinea mesophila]